MFRRISEGTVTNPRGFNAWAIHAGIKPGDALDLGILCSDVPCIAAGVFTTNRLKAAPVVLSQNRLAKKMAQAIVVNSGCANAYTAERGQADAVEITRLVARKLGIPVEDVLIASTGTIGTYLPMSQIEKGIRKVAPSPEHGHELARAIMTTDTLPKEIAGVLKIDGEKVIIGGIAKGAGMIHPNMATLLCFLSTDASVDGDLLQTALRSAVDGSFNMLTIDGDTSPNDTVILLANGLAGNKLIKAGTPEGEMFQDALQNICIQLCKSIAGDGEGSTKLIEVTVEGALTVSDARIAARTVAGSSLVKTAIHGRDPNWGRIIAALGRSGVEVVGSKIDLCLSGICIMKEGHSQPFSVDEARAALCRSEVSIKICLNLGVRKATAWGCDLSEDYVTINSTQTT